MRVIFFNYEYPPLGGGAGNATFYLLREYAKIPGLEVDLVTSSVDDFKIEEIYPNIRVHYLDINKNGHLHYQSIRDLLVYSFKLYFYGRKLAQKNKYDLCHAFFGIPCGYIAMHLGIPYMVSLRGSDVPFYNKRFYFLDKFLFKYLSRDVWKKSRAVVSLSHDLNDIARKTSAEQKIAVIYNGINIEEFFPDPEVLKEERTFNILFVGRLIERKGLNYLLEAFKEISGKHEQARLLVAGDGPLKEDYVSYAKSEGLEDKVLFLGRVEHSEIAKIYRRCHVFVLPSLNEALGNVTQEALASGLPIITTKTGAAELMEGNGYIIKKQSSVEIEQSLEALISDEKLRQKMSVKSRKLAETMSWESTAQKYYQLYKKMHA